MQRFRLAKRAPDRDFSSTVEHIDVALGARSEIWSKRRMPPPVDLVCFDLGKVLVAIADGWADACERAGVVAPASLSTPDVRARLGELLVPFELGRIDLDAHAREAGACIGVEAALVRRAIESWLIGPYPGAVELVMEVSATGVPCACLSNTNHRHWDQMSAPDGPFGELFARFEHRFASHLIGAIKPDPAIYQHVERATGVRPGSVLFFDDLEANVTAARARGWRAHRVSAADPAAQLRRLLRQEGVLAG